MGTRTRVKQAIVVGIVMLLLAIGLRMSPAAAVGAAELAYEGGAGLVR